MSEQHLSPVRRLIRAAGIGEELDGKTNCEIAELLRQGVWAHMEIGTEELELVEQAIERLSVCPTCHRQPEEHGKRGECRVTARSVARMGGQVLRNHQWRCRRVRER
jgi:hypothetical protein